MVCTKKPPHFIASAHSRTHLTPEALPTMHFAPRVLHFSAIHLHIIYLLGLTELNETARVMLSVTVCHTQSAGSGYVADGGVFR